MATIQQTLSHTLRSMRDMSLSQRAAILLGAALVVGSLLWLGQWAATPEMVPLLPQDLAPEDLARARAGLDAMNEKYVVQGSRLLVSPGANRPAIIAQLQQSDQLPGDTSIGFAALVKETNPWISQEENNRRWTVALQAELERVLKQFAGVRQAHVFLNLTDQRRGFSREMPRASASVTLVTKGGEPVSRVLALAAARLVSGAVRGLPLRNVEVVDANGASALDWSSEDPASSAALDRRCREQEVIIADKIRGQLAFDPRARVNVQVELEHTSRDTRSRQPTSPVDIRETRTQETTSRNRRSGQPGVEPNVGAVANSGGSDETHTKKQSEVEKTAGETETVESTPAGAILDVYAAVNISYSYLASVWSRKNPTATDPPTEQQVQVVFDEQKRRIVNQVAAFVLRKDADVADTDKFIRVDWYYDAVDPAGAVAATQAASADGLLEIARAYGPAGGLAALALVSLGLMMRLARRSGEAGEAFGLEIGLPKEAIEAAKTAAADLERAAAVARRAPAAAAAPRAAAGAAAPGAEEPLAAAIPTPVGMALATDGILEAQEIDESTLRVNNMLAQISERVQQDPDGVASLIQNWMDADR
jgi:flagellar biosynthesis/type III secretory pathway M-ring protein FliF/YscJ